MYVYVPLSYSAWFDSEHNKARALYYLSNDSFRVYKSWCNATKIN